MKKIILLLLMAGLLFAQNEVRLNTFTQNEQRDPVIVTNGNKAMVVWQSYNQFSDTSKGDIAYIMLNDIFEPDGEEVIIGVNPNLHQERPDADINSENNFGIVYAVHTNTPESIFDIEGYLNVNGTIGYNWVNDNPENSQTKPQAIFYGTNDNNISVVFESWEEDGSNKGVFFKSYTEYTNQEHTNRLANTTTAKSQGRPGIVAVGDNRVVFWESWDQVGTTPAGYDLYGAVIDNQNNIVGNKEELLNNYTIDNQWYADADAIDDNEFVLTWCSWNQDGQDGGIYIKKFHIDNGNIIADSEEILVNQTTTFYQWLPKVKVRDNGNIVVVWSSWKQDGSREGIYCREFNSNMKPLSLEMQINEQTEGFQWEPDFIPVGDDEIYVVWSNWTNDEDRYDIYGKLVTMQYDQGTINNETFEHTFGSTTSKLNVHVADSTLMNGHTYDVTFNVIDDESVSFDVTDVTANELKIDDFIMNRGEDSFYLTSFFDGIAVQVVPHYKLELDYNGSHFEGSEDQNLSFELFAPSTNFELAPIDVQIIWGTQDTAYNASGSKVVVTPFTAMDITNDEKCELFIEDGSHNDTWDVGESITILTPAQYATGFPRFHAVVRTTEPTGNVVMPENGDVFNVFTKRPVTNQDVFRFVANKDAITEIENTSLNPDDFSLQQNYPNPFNPSTTINFSIPEAGKVKLAVYNILGEKVSELLNGELNSGIHKVAFNAAGLPSGVYIYSLQTGNKMISKKMMLLK